MKRVFTAITLTVAGLAALLGFKTRDLSASPGTTEAAAGSTTTTIPGATTSTAAGTTTTTTAVATGTIEADGPVVRIPFGPVQVSVVVTDGVLVDVVALQLPGGNEESNQINAYAAPRLREMALQAQSANIDVVSGATFTSRGYAQSLQGALDAAGF
jgi:uncharacterized protein with FMN-binding domain